MTVLPYPAEIEIAMKILENNGFSAYIVGGCVRDFMMKNPPKDYDMTTNALPCDIKNLFRDYKVIETGIKHGTITVIISSIHIEITTYRIDGEYTDCRHPATVIFTDRLFDDLSRRDFTMNALAYNKKSGIADYHNGVSDIQNRVIRCVGNPDKRFREDALRIMRALRFASQLGFEIDEETSNAIFRNKELLLNISKERLRDEFIKLLCGYNVAKILLKYYSVIAIFIPEIDLCVGFDQRSIYHKYDVWEHIVGTVSASPQDEIIRLTMFFHDIAKPICYKLGEDGHGHFKGHDKNSAELTSKIMKRLCFDRKLSHSVCTLVLYHCTYPKKKASIKRLLAEIGLPLYLDLFEVQCSDDISKEAFCMERISENEQTRQVLEEIINEESCINRKKLDINGNDIMNLGAKGRGIGQVLDHLLQMVIEEKVENKKEKLIEKAEEFIHSELNQQLH